ncbi:Uncharacterized protein OS=Sphingobium herbicidovorans (strain ATCC 700291 / DSM 11019 / NBRC 16415 / MH) GN=BV98_002977 PE=4 SV=1 [Gemmata massiliana]|uniref:Uncharacterized protein n=1 Tax=Gemmata massiliana TaxID=1210884 RepID=A0A6P2DH43_9BACT|nr:DUF1007 family protein [Gemmata massiliana]VTS01170.1 Uncharacterized protein OS=Sphingobium herbicidovorans (strain ATCC 700291 / DSM 11019 / NBRC 16415 / MH) GN=BV98_002977 PE=4 SV=1 [Gemmata massiliana]
MTPLCSNPSCYAQQLCDCRGPVNREHVVSRSLLEAIWPEESGGLVSGLTFLRNDSNNPARLGIGSLTAKILCEGHNRDLSPFDAEMTEFFKATERLLLDDITGGRIGHEYFINGDCIERWMLKTLCGGLFSGNFPVPFVNSFAGQLPPSENLQTIFRSSSFPPGRGLYVTHDQSRVDHHVFRLTVVGAPSGIVGLRMWLFGSLYTLVLIDDHEPFPELASATYRPARTVATKNRNTIAMSWVGEHSAGPLELVFSDTPFE